MKWAKREQEKQDAENEAKRRDSVQAIAILRIGANVGREVAKNIGQTIKEASSSGSSNLSAPHSDCEIISNINAKLRITPQSAEYPDQFSIRTKDNEKSFDQDYHSSITDNSGQKREFTNSIDDNSFYAYGYSKNYPMTIHISYLSYKGTWVSASIKANRAILIEITPNN